METVVLKKIFINILYVPMSMFIVWSGVNAEAVAALTFLLLVDMFTGVWKTVRIGAKPRSSRFANGILSKMVLLLIPISLAVAAKGVGVDIASLVSAVIGALILSELYSIIANIATIQTGKEQEEFDVLSLILRQIRKTINKILGDI